MKLTTLTRAADDLNLPFLISSLGISIILIWIGSFKFSPVEARGIQAFVSNSPLLGWTYKLFSVAVLARILGVIEITAALCILAGNFMPKVGIVGSLLSTAMFFVTSTFILSTPGTVQNINGTWELSELGTLLFKDVIILGASLYLFIYFGRKAYIEEKRDDLKNVDHLI